MILLINFKDSIKYAFEEHFVNKKHCRFFVNSDDIKSIKKYLYDKDDEYSIEYVIFFAEPLDDFLNNFDKENVFSNALINNTKIIKLISKFNKIKSCAIILNEKVYALYNDDIVKNKVNIDEIIKRNTNTVNSINNTNIINKNFLYYPHKMIMEQFKIFEKNNKFSIVVVPEIFGPGDNFSIFSNKIIPSTIEKFYKANGNKVVPEINNIIGKKQFIFSEDLKNELINLIFVKPIGIYNITTYENYEYISVINFISLYTNIKYKLCSKNTKKLDDIYVKPTLEEYKNFKLNCALRKTISWYYDNFENK